MPLEPDYPVAGDYWELGDNSQWECFLNPATGNLEQRQISPPKYPPLPPGRRHIPPEVGQAWKSLLGGPVGGMGG